MKVSFIHYFFFFFKNKKERKRDLVQIFIKAIVFFYFICSKRIVIDGTFVKKQNHRYHISIAAWLQSSKK